MHLFFYVITLISSLTEAKTTVSIVLHCIIRRDNKSSNKCKFDYYDGLSVQNNKAFFFMQGWVGGGGEGGVSV